MRGGSHLRGRRREPGSSDEISLSLSHGVEAGATAGGDADEGRTAVCRVIDGFDQTLGEQVVDERLNVLTGDGAGAGQGWYGLSASLHEAFEHAAVAGAEARLFVKRAGGRGETMKQAPHFARQQ
jgi:hypothetical protein